MSGMTPDHSVPPASRLAGHDCKVMRLTEAAAARVRELSQIELIPRSSAFGSGSRMVAAPDMSYTVEYAHDVRPNDEVVEDKGVKILVDPKAILFLLGTEMDFKVDKMAAQFVFNNPNQTGACGCGGSVQLTPAKMPV